MNGSQNILVELFVEEPLLKAAHSCNLLLARGAIGVTGHAPCIGRIRNLAQSGYFAPRRWVEQMPTKAA
jgi:glycyl-tRNA synthetase alpha subunit